MTARMTLASFDQSDPPDFEDFSQQAAREMLAATGGVIVTPLRQALLSVRRLSHRDAATTGDLARHQHYMFDTPLDADAADSRNAGLWV